MDTAGIMVIILFMLLGVLFFMMRKPKEGDGSSNLVVGDAYKAKGSDRVIKNNHVIHTIYRYDGHEDVWTCPNCDAESSGERSVCPVCHYSEESGGM